MDSHSSAQNSSLPSQQSEEEIIVDHNKSPLWNYVENLEKLGTGGGNAKWRCKLCDETKMGSLTRVRQHLLKISGKGISVCKKATRQQISEMKEMDEEFSNRSQGAKTVSLPSDSGTGSSISRPPSGAGTSGKRQKPNPPNPIVDAYCIEDRDGLDSRIGRMFFTGGVSFNLSRNPYFQSSYIYACDRTKNLSGYKPPGFNKLRTTLLDKEKKHVEKCLQPIKGVNHSIGPSLDSKMALVLICGQPCSGKSSASACLAEDLRESDSKLTVRIIDETSFHLDRNQSYASMPNEKNLRGVLRSEVDRSLTRDNIIIVDSLNSIKGYRYELWCLARAAGVRYCVVYCNVEDAQCRKWNEARREKGQESYEENIFEDLLRRFECPDSKNRWDSPLFEMWPVRDGIEKTPPAVADVVLYLTKKVDSRTKDIKILQPSVATQSARFSEANSLYETDRATQEVMSAIVEAQAQAMGGPLNLGQGLPGIVMLRPVGLPELRRLRKTFIKLTGQASLSGRAPPADAESAKRMFVDFLNRELGAA